MSRNSLSSVHGELSDLPRLRSVIVRHNQVCAFPFISFFIIVFLYNAELCGRGIYSVPVTVLFSQPPQRELISSARYGAQYSRNLVHRRNAASLRLSDYWPENDWNGSVHFSCLRISSTVLLYFSINQLCCSLRVHIEFKCYCVLVQPLFCCSKPRKP